MKKIVTHINPDLDAVTSCWLIKRFLPGWEKAGIDYCEPQTTIDGQPVDLNPEILHVDVGMGKLDHHHTSEYLSAAQLTFDFIKEQRKGKPIKVLTLKALEEMVSLVNEVDNARDLVWPETQTPRYDFYLNSIIAGVRGMSESDSDTMKLGLLSLDAVLHQAKKRIDAEKELENGIEFESSWGKSIGIKTGNDNVLFEGEKKDYAVVIRKDEQTGGVRIYARWDKGVDLESAYKEIKKLDAQSEWFLHASHCLLLNMSTSKPMKPTKLSLEEIIKVLKKK